jgi:hypothetical protein
MLKVIAKLGDIPIGATVTKTGGTKEYVVRDRVDIYNEQGEPQRIHANEGCLYLIGSEGHINAYGFEKELVWYTDLETLNFLAEGAPK